MMILQYLSDMKTKTKKIKLKLVTGCLLLVKEDMKRQHSAILIKKIKDKFLERQLIILKCLKKQLL